MAYCTTGRNAGTLKLNQGASSHSAVVNRPEARGALCRQEHCGVPSVPLATVLLQTSLTPQ